MRTSQRNLGGHMPEYERAVRMLSVDDLLARLADHADGIAAKELLTELITTYGVEPRVARLLIQSQIDSGQIRLGDQMKLTVARPPVAA